MQYETLELDVPHSNGSGAAVRIERHRIKTFFVTGTFTATVTVEISPSISLPLDDFGWFPAAPVVVGTDGPTVKTVEHACMWARVTVADYVSGQPEVVFAGYDVV